MARRDLSIRPSEKYLQPFIDEFIKKNGGKKWTDINKFQRYRFYDSVIPKIKKFLKESKGLIRRQELAKMLGVSNDYLRSIAKGQGDKGGPNVRYKIFQDILGDVKKIYRPVSGANEGFYKKPTVSQIEAFKKNIRSSTILPVMQERVNAFVNNKKFMNMLKNDDLTDPNFLNKAKKIFPKLDLTDQKLADGVLYIARGSKGDEFLGTTIKKNLPLHKRLIKQFEESKWGNPFHAAAYKFARTEIDQQLGTKEGTFQTYQSELRNAFKNAGFKNLKNYEVDEIVGTSIGGKQQFAPYSVFSRFVSEKYNAGPGAAYQGALSRASTSLSKIVQGDKTAINDYTKKLQNTLDYIKFPSNVKKTGFTADRVKYIKENYPRFIKAIQKDPSKAPTFFVDDFNTTVANTYEKKYGVKVARPDLQTPEVSFGKKRFEELGKLGTQIEESYKQKGFGFKIPEGSLTQKELLQSVASLKPGTKAFKAVCTITKADGGSVDACVERVAQEPEKFANKFKNLTAVSGPLARIKNASVNFLKSPGFKTFSVAGLAGGAAAALVKEFRNDDPTTYLSNEDQQKSMLVDMVTQPISEDMTRPDILDYQLPAVGASLAASTALAAPSTIKASRSRGLGVEQKGLIRTGGRVLGRGLGVAASPGVLAPLAAMDIADQISEGDSISDIATNPFNYTYPIFAEQTPKLTKGLPSAFRKFARLGMSKPALRLLSRAGIAGLGASLAIQGIGLLDD